MDRDSLRELRLDRRLIGRRNWIKNEELEQALAELPDVSDKVAPPEDGPDASDDPSSG